MPAPKLEALTWVLIYGGILGAILGWFLAPVRGPWGELLISAGAVAVAAGLVLIFLRSKMKP